MRNFTMAASLILLAATITACTGGGGDTVDVAVVLETDNTVEALISVEGGVISATGSDGTIYTLEIPGDALLNEVTIGLTPLSSISGLPFGGDQTYAVQLSPTGLTLRNFAILTITPAADIPTERQIMFGYLGEGEDVILAAPVVDSSEIKINVLHFSGNGVTNGAPTEIDRARERLGGDAERRLQNEAAAYLGQERADQLMGLSEGGDLGPLIELMGQYEEQVVKVRVAAAGESCAAGELAVQTALSHERTRQLLGLDPEGNGFFQKYPGLFDKAGRACIIEAFEACVEGHGLHLLDPLVVYEGMLRQNAINPIYSAGTLAEARDLTIKCMTFRLEFESEVSYLFAGWKEIESSVTAEIILKYNPGSSLTSGRGEYVNTHFDIRETHPHLNCTYALTPGGGIFVVLGISWDIEVGPPDANGNYPNATVSKLRMVYFPDDSTERATESCRDEGAIYDPDTFDIGWSYGYYVVHKELLEVGFGYENQDWEISTGALFAELEWNLQGSDDNGTTGTDEGSFRLYHTPGG